MDSLVGDFDLSKNVCLLNEGFKLNGAIYILEKAYV